MKKVVFFIIVIICIGIIFQSLMSIYASWKKQDLVIQTQKELQKIEKENASLKSQLREVQSAEFIERKAREELFLVKNNEKSVMLSQDLLKKKQQAIVIEKNVSIWKQWLRLFL